MNNLKDNLIKKEEEVKNNNLFIVLGIILGIVILFGAYYIGRSITNRQKQTEEKFNNIENLSDFSLNGNTCHNRFNYFIVTKAEINDPGENILIKYKKDSEKEFDCNYKVEEGDFELLNIRSEGDSIINFAQYFSYLKDNFLIIDEGTGTSRTVKIFDIEKQKEIFSDNYHGELDLKDNILNYWRATKDIPNQENCSKVDEYKKSGMGAQIETKVSFNLTDLTKKEFKEFRCLQAE